MIDYSIIQQSLKKMLQGGQIILTQAFRESQQTRSRLIRRNRNMIIRDSSNANPLMDLAARIMMPRVRRLNAGVRQSVRYLPDPSFSAANNPQYSFYTRTFRFLYLYLGRRGQSIWDDFKKTYEEFVPNEQRPLQNMFDCTQDSDMERRIYGLMESGLQFRLVIEKECWDRAIGIVRGIINKDQVSEVVVERSEWGEGRLEHNKMRGVFSLGDQFSREIKRAIKMSTNKGVTLQYNFISMNSRSSEISHRKSVIQECIKPKEPEEYLETHDKFTTMLATYENRNLASQRERILYNSEAGDNMEKQLEKINDRAQKEKEQERQFCAWLRGKLESGKPIEFQEDKEQTLLQVLKAYKKQTSIYDVINSNMRLSISVNESKIKELATIIKYLHESIRYFSDKHKGQIREKSVFRGCLMSAEEFDQLTVGSIVINLGFMSTSRNRIAAENFVRKKANSCLIEVELGDEILSDEDQEGFIFYQLLIQDLREKQALFNLFNIFEVLYRKAQYEQDPQMKYVKLKYAPHVALLDKMKKNLENVTAEEKAKYNMIKSHISCLTRSNYDRGKVLHLKGHTTKALEHYEQAERAGETLTVDQQLNKIEILANNKQFDKISTCVEQLITSSERKLKELDELKQNGSEQGKKLTASQKIEKIVNLTKQSQYLQLTSNFLESEKRAQRAKMAYKALSQDIVKQNKEITDKQFAETLMLDIRSTALLAKTRCEINDIESSLCQSYEGLRIIDHVHQRFQESILPKINKIISQVRVNFDEKPMLKKIKEAQQVVMQANANLRARLKKIQKEKEDNRWKNQRDQKKNIVLMCRQIVEYLEESQKKGRKMLEVYYGASLQIEQVSGNSNSSKLAKSALLELRETAEQLMHYENYFYSLIKSNLKSANQNIKPCLNAEKRMIEYRYGSLSNLAQSARKELDKDLNIETINQYSNYASFLLEYAGMMDETRERQKIESLRETRRLILSKLNSRVEEQCKIITNVSQASYKTALIQSQCMEFKNNCCDSNIIQTQINQLKKSGQIKSGTSIMTISSFKKKESFEDLRANLRKLEDIHENDDQINKFYFLLKDITDELDLLNSSYSVADTSQEFSGWLAEANRKAELFEEKYIHKQQIRQTEVLARYFYERARNQLKLGYFRESRRSLKKAQDCLENVYDQKVGSGSGSGIGKGSDRLTRLQRDELNPLYARDVTILCYRLESELIGVYFGEEQRKHKLKQMQYMRQFVGRVSPNKVFMQALINQAVAFLAVRCLPMKVPLTQECLRSSLQLRKNMFGENNEHRAIGCCLLAEIESSQRQPDQTNIRKYYQEGLKIFESLQKQIPNQSCSYLDKEPALYLYKMRLQAIGMDRLNIIPAAQKQAKIAKNYLRSIGLYDKNCKDIKSFWACEKIMLGCESLASQDMYKRESEQLLKRCESEIASIYEINKVDENSEEQKGIERAMNSIKQRLYSAFVSFYSRHESNELSKYLGLLKHIKSMLEPQRPPSHPPSQVQKVNFLDYLAKVMGCFGDNKTAGRS